MIALAGYCYSTSATDTICASENTWRSNITITSGCTTTAGTCPTCCASRGTAVWVTIPDDWCDEPRQSDERPKRKKNNPIPPPLRKILKFNKSETESIRRFHVQTPDMKYILGTTNIPNIKRSRGRKR